jgi:hypothetical protein
MEKLMKSEKELPWWLVLLLVLMAASTVGAFYNMWCESHHNQVEDSLCVDKKLHLLISEPDGTTTWYQADAICE